MYLNKTVHVYKFFSVCVSILSADKSSNGVVLILCLTNNSKLVTLSHCRRHRQVNTFSSTSKLLTYLFDSTKATTESFQTALKTAKRALNCQL